ncbi:transcription initiation factor TFIID subunit 9 [Histoplasma capsulatum G186AR]|uniref:Transcription initiation factor TFIID subunit 9 n=1 Tax=Ajellomyces capsulatus (strain G186AR / H82 / ATCC MYA-2454 / RMSCC 2432) TaxID=447093 RepID=C0NEX7_AJECG|nr:transcription initiation factor TFIID subunit 9 [Histoplasma capsulatum G186AR]EEH09798.1 transcription initiation factor TFIID subunit 9 [Histoplasma capsulatum G186AR]
MTSPRSNPGASAPSTQPLTPPADAPSSTSNNPSQANNPATTTATNNTSANPGPANATILPATSLQDTGKSRRPRDARLIHMLLASLGVTAYQERVPLQLLDFAYRYTSSTLQDAVYLATEGYPGESAGAGTSTSKGGGDGKAQGGGQQAANLDLSSVSLGALRMSIASRLHYQFQPGLPKEFLMDVAAERNRMMLPGVMRGVDGGVAASAAAAASAGGVMMGGMRLPPERFCLTGVGWGLKEEWESEGEEETGEGEMEIDADGNNNSGQQQAGGTGQVSITNERGDGGEDEDDGDGAMEDIFGDEGLDGEVRDEDKTMTDV